MLIPRAAALISRNKAGDDQGGPALVWAVTWTGAGYALGNVATGLSTPFGIATTVIVLAAAIAAIGFALMHRPTSQPRQGLGDRRGDMELDGVTCKPAHAQQHRDRDRLDPELERLNVGDAAHTTEGYVQSHHDCHHDADRPRAAA